MKEKANPVTCVILFPFSLLSGEAYYIELFWNIYLDMQVLLEKF